MSTKGSESLLSTGGMMHLWRTSFWHELSSEGSEWSSWTRTSGNNDIRWKRREEFCIREKNTHEETYFYGRLSWVRPCGYAVIQQSVDRFDRTMSGRVSRRRWDLIMGGSAWMSIQMRTRYSSKFNKHQPICPQMSQMSMVQSYHRLYSIYMCLESVGGSSRG